MTDWEVWAAGTLGGVSAPINFMTADVLWAWSHAESGDDLMRWLNPLNTTQLMFGSLSMNSVGVQRYRSIQDGIDATVFTLLNGYYPVILANLRGSVPRAQWQNACPNLGTWGTGCGWLQSTYGPAPGDLGVDDMFTDNDRAILVLLQKGLFGSSPADGTGLQVDVAAVKQQLDLLQAGMFGSEALAPPGIQAQLQTIVTAAQGIQAATGGLTPAQAQQLAEVLAKLTGLTLKAA